MEIKELIAIFFKKRARFSLGLLLFLLIDISAIGLVAVSGWFLTSCALAGLSLVGVSFNVFAPSGPIRIFALLRPVSVYFSNIVNHRIMLNVLTDLRVLFFNKLSLADAAGWNSFSAGNMHERWSKNLINTAFSFQQVLLPLIATFLLFIGFIISVFFYKSYAVLLLMIVQMALALGVIFFSFQYIAKDIDVLTKARGRVRKAVVEFISILDVLEIYNERDNYEKYALRTFKRYGKREVKKNCILWLGENVLDAMVHSILIVWLYVIIEDVSNEIYSSSFAVLLFLAQWAFLTILTSLFPVFQNYLNIQRTENSTLVEPLFLEHRFKGPESKLPQLQVINLTYSYPGTFTNILDVLNIDFKPNSVTVIKGSNGTGKSTLLNIVSGSYVVSPGQVFIKGEDISCMRKASIRAAITLSAQNPYIFKGSLRENLLLEKHIEDATVLETLDKLHLKEWYLSLENGFDTQIKTSHVNLSGGQIKMIGFARCLLRDTAIMLFDEPTEGLDAKNEMLMLHILKDLSATKTIVVVSHKTIVQDYFTDFVTL